MALVLIIGAVALDRPIWLDRPLLSGGRSRGHSLEGRLEGRLGGGAANAGCVLRAAGHRVLVAASLAGDEDGAHARGLAEAAGLDLGLTAIRPGESSKTLIFIDPAGERTIIGLDGSVPERWPSVVGPDEAGGIRPEGLLIRSAFAGAADWARAVTGPVVLHWPAPGYAGEADVVVASADDLPEDVAREPYAAAVAAVGPRLRWVVVTHGADGAVAHGADETIVVPAPARVVKDATGAGDAFAAGLLDALVAGAPMARAVEHACAWGGDAVELEGSAPTAAPKGAFRGFAAVLQS